LAIKIKVEEYICLNGSNPYEAWFDNLDPQAAAKIFTAVRAHLNVGIEAQTVQLA
jgi:hypothetical protein